MPKPFTDPFKDALIHRRFVSKVDADIYNFFYAVHPGKGLQQTTINLLFKKLYDKCIERGITNFHREADFEHFVANCDLVLIDDAGSPDKGSLPANAGRNDGRRTSNVAGGDKVVKNVSTNIPGGTGKRRDGKSNGKKG